MSDPTQRAYERIDEWVQSAQQRAERAKAVKLRLAQREVPAESPDGLVRVTVDAQGLPTALEIDDRALTGRGADLASTILDTLRRAQSRLTDEVSGLAMSTFGPSSPDAKAIARSYEQRFDTSQGRGR